MAITPKQPGGIQPPNTIPASTTGNVSVPNSLTSKAKGNVAVPNNLAAEAVGAVAAPNTVPASTAGSVTAPNSLTSKAKGNVAIPNSLSAETTGTVAIPNTLTTKPSGQVTAPNNLIAEGTGQVSAPNILSSAVKSALPRTLTPLVDLNFADQNYSQCGEPVLFDDLFTYSRPSSGTFINRIAKCSGGYEYFLDTDFVGNVTNLLTYSEQFDNPSWVTTQASVVKNLTEAPNGTITADKLVENTVNTAHHIQLSNIITINSGAKATVSVYAKSAGRRFIELQTVQSVTGKVYFDLVRGVITATSGTGSPIGSIKDAGNGWWLCSLTVTNIGTDIKLRVSLSSTGNSVSYLGDGASGVLLWGAQLTEASKTLPYVKTIATSASKTFFESLRYEYDPETGKSLGALIEGGSTNLSRRSEEIEDGAWVKDGTTIGANTIPAPDLTISADKMIEDTATGSHRVFQGFSSVAGSSYTCSVYVKQAERTTLRLTVTSGSGGDFDLIAKTSASFGGSTSSIKELSNGWFRCSFTFVSALTAEVFQVRLSESLGAVTYTGDGSSGLYIWGTQVEELPFASSYIRTEGSAVSRSGDSLFLDRSGVIEAKASTSKSVIAKYSLEGIQTDPANGFNTLFRSTEANFLMRVGSIGAPSIVVIHGTGSSSLLPVNGSDLTNRKAAVVVDSSLATATIYDDSGGSISFTPTDAAGTLTGWQIGAAVGGAVQNLFGYIENFVIYEQALTAQEVTLL